VTTEGPETRTAVPSDPLSFDDLYAAHYVALTVQLFAYFGDRQQAQDIVQEAFCRALIRWRTVSADDDPVAWVRRAAWQLALSRWRRGRTLAGLMRRKRVAGPRAGLLGALGTLPPAHRRALVLRYVGDLTVIEIAGQEGVAVETVESWLHRARSALDTDPEFSRTESAEPNAQEVRRA
jgi:RNA polymerase sigma-70 factor (ECF subfamily)